METNLIEHLKSVFAWIQQGSMDERSIAGLQAHRFTTTNELIKLLLTSPNAGLVFMAYQDQAGNSWYSVGQLEAVKPGRYLDAISGKLVLVQEEFFDMQYPRMIMRLKQHLQMGDQLFQLDGSQIQQWQWTFNKIEGMMSSDYQLRREYLQEMVMQAVHLALKQITGNKILLSAFHPIKIAAGDNDVPGLFPAKFTEASTLSAN